MAQSGQITVTTAGTAVAGPNEVGAIFQFEAHPDNDDVTWVGEDGGSDVSPATGYPLRVNGTPVIKAIGNLNLLWFDANVSGDVIAWSKIE